MAKSHSLNIDGVDCSVFTYALLKSVGAKYPNAIMTSSMPGDTDGDRKLTLMEAYLSITETIEELRRITWAPEDQRTVLSGDRMCVLFEK